MGLLLKFVIGFAIVGLLVSFPIGLLVGNHISYVIIVSFISTVLSAGLGFGVVKVLELRVPEFFQYFGEGNGQEYYEDGNYEGSGDEMNASSSSGDYDVAGAMSGEDENIASNSDMKEFGDHILVNKVKIKNEPKLMAEAIRTMLAKDDG